MGILKPMLVCTKPYMPSSWHQPYLYTIYSLHQCWVVPVPISKNWIENGSDFPNQNWNRSFFVKYSQPDLIV